MNSFVEEFEEEINEVAEEEIFDEELEELEDLKGPAVFPTQVAPTVRTSVPDNIQKFVYHLHRSVQERNVGKLEGIYQSDYYNFSEKYYKNTPWPPAESVAPFVNNDQLTLTLYKELYFRHIYSRCDISLEHRLDSWKNYCEFFNFLLNSSPSLSLDLPSQWMWDITDEFIYQFQSFCQYRSKLKQKPTEELTVLKNNPQVWSASTVVNYLQSLVSKSGIVSILERQKVGILDLESFGAHPVFRSLGYFSMFGLLRVHCLLGDYYLALKSVAPVDLFTKGMFADMASCNASLYYYSGFAYVMMRRYSDAVRVFTTGLPNVAKKNYPTRTHMEEVTKRIEQIYSLLAICLSLNPQRIEDNIHITLREKHNDKMVRMQKGEEKAFEEAFSFSCPKFVSPFSPNYSAVLEDKYPAMNYNQDALRLQTRLFLQEIKQQALLPTIRSYLKLYTTIETKKLADFLPAAGSTTATTTPQSSKMSDSELRPHLLAYKHKTRSLVWDMGPPLAGEWTSTSDVDFFVDKEMIHIQDSKVTRRYTEFFIRHISRFEDIIQSVEKNSKKK